MESYICNTESPLTIPLSQETQKINPEKSCAIPHRVIHMRAYLHGKPMPLAQSSSQSIIRVCLFCIGLSLSHTHIHIHVYETNIGAHQMLATDASTP